MKDDIVLNVSVRVGLQAKVTGLRVGVGCGTHYLLREHLDRQGNTRPMIGLANMHPCTIIATMLECMVNQKYLGVDSQT